MAREDPVYGLKGDPVYNVKDLEKKLKLSKKTIRHYIKTGRLKAKKIGKAYLITETNLIKFLDPKT